MAFRSGSNWDPEHFALGTLGPPNDPEPGGPHPFTLLILNQPIEDLELFKALSKSALWTVCADGGMNRVFELPMEHGEMLHHHTPDAVCGDMDSVRPEVVSFFRKGKEVDVVEDSTQDSTDFMKSLRYINHLATIDGRLESRWLRYNHGEPGESEEAFRYKVRQMRMPRQSIVILGGLGGRADQAFSQLHHLYAASQEPLFSTLGQLYLITPESIIFLLSKGLNLISTPVGPGRFTENVGLIPIGKPSIITTRGLQWDVTNWPTEIGGQISTSNHIKEDFVEVETTERVLFTMEFSPLESSGGCLQKTSLWTWVD